MDKKLYLESYKQVLLLHAMQTKFNLENGIGQVIRATYTNNRTNKSQKYTLKQTELSTTLSYICLVRIWYVLTIGNPKAFERTL